MDNAEEKVDENRFETFAFKYISHMHKDPEPTNSYVSTLEKTGIWVINIEFII